MALLLCLSATILLAMLLDNVGSLISPCLSDSEFISLVFGFSSSSSFSFSSTSLSSFSSSSFSSSSFSSSPFSSFFSTSLSFSFSSSSFSSSSFSSFSSSNSLCCFVGLEISMVKSSSFASSSPFFTGDKESGEQSKLSIVSFFSLSADSTSGVTFAVSDESTGSKDSLLRSTF